MIVHAPSIHDDSETGTTAVGEVQLVSESEKMKSAKV